MEIHVIPLRFFTRDMMEFKIMIMDETGCFINKIWFDINEFRESFIPGFCSTVYKFQGADIDQHYNIYDVNQMDKKQLYTCLSGTTKYEYIHLDSETLKKCFTPSPQPRLEKINSY